VTADRIVLEPEVGRGNIRIEPEYVGCSIARASK
jgi:hypothetical protein